jgi:hypothetical protein
MTKRPSEITIADMNRECVQFLFDQQTQADARGYNILLKHQVDELVRATNSRTSRLVQGQNYRATETQYRILSDQWDEFILTSDA